MEQLELQMRFTKENAAHFSKLGAEAIRVTKAERKQRYEILRQLECGDKRFQLETLGRVRVMIDKTLTTMEKEDDAVKLDRLAAALARLETMERNLSMRQAPGTAKPGGQPTEQAPSSDSISPA